MAVVVFSEARWYRHTPSKTLDLSHIICPQNRRRFNFYETHIHIFTLSTKKEKRIKKERNYRYY